MKTNRPSKANRVNLTSSTVCATCLVLRSRGVEGIEAMEVPIMPLKRLPAVDGNGNWCKKRPHPHGKKGGQITMFMSLYKFCIYENIHTDTPRKEHDSGKSSFWIPNTICFTSGKVKKTKCHSKQLATTKFPRNIMGYVPLFFRTYTVLYILVGGWTNPSENIAHQIGFIFPKYGWTSKIFETTT